MKNIFFKTSALGFVGLYLALLSSSLIAHTGHSHHHHRHHSLASESANNPDHRKAKDKLNKDKWWNVGIEVAAHSKHFHHGVREIKPGGVYEFSPHFTLWDHVTIGGSTFLGTHRYYTESNAYINFSYEYKQWLGEIGYGFRRKQTNYNRSLKCHLKPKMHHHDDDHDDDDDDGEDDEHGHGHHAHGHKYHDEHSFNFALSYLGLPYIVPSLHGHWVFRENLLFLEPAINAYFPLVKNKTHTILTLNPAIEFGVRAYPSKKDHETHDHADDENEYHCDHHGHDHIHYTNFRLQFDYAPTSYIKISPYIAHLIPLESGPHGNHTYGGIKVSFEY